MQYKVVSIYCNCLMSDNDTSAMEEALNELSQEGWKPLHITPSPDFDVDDDGRTIQVGTNMVITFVKE